MNKRIGIFIFALFALIPALAQAHMPDAAGPSGTAVEDGVLDLGLAMRIGDPTAASVAVYDSVLNPDEVKLYSFNASESASLPFEALVPVRTANEYFRPWIIVVSKGAEEEPDERPFPFELPPGYLGHIIPPPSGPRPTFFEPFSLERYWRGTELALDAEKGETYYVAVFDPLGATGDYSLGIGTKEDFSNVSYPSLLADVARVKLGLVGGREVPWRDALGFFLLFAGFALGLGAVTVIDVIGFLGRKSSYWTETAIRAHKVTKPLIWAGIALAAAGGALYYSYIGFASLAPVHALIAVVLVANGAFLSFKVSPELNRLEREGKSGELLPPKLQKKIFASFVVSFALWWAALALFAWHAAFLR